MTRTIRPTTSLARNAYPAATPAPRALVHRVSRRWWHWYVVAALLCCQSQLSAAQDPDHPWLGITPDSIVLTDQVPTATITLTNTENNTREVWLAPECPAGDYAMVNGNMFYPWLPKFDPLAAVWRNTSGCAVPWLSGYPRHLALAPHEQRKIPIRIDPPSTLQNGRYGVRLIWAIYVTEAGNEGIAHYEVPITYIRGPWHQRRWQPTPSTGPGSAVVQGTPAAVVLDDSSRTTTFTLYNSATRPTEVWLYVDCPWFIVNFVSYPLSHEYEAAWHGRSANASIWIGGFPQHVVLAPHEKRTFPIELSPGLPLLVDNDGNEYARVVYAEAPVILVSPKGDTTFTTPSGGVNVVVRTHRLDANNRPVWPSLTLSQPWVRHYTVAQQPRQAVCDTLQQPGLGFVATVHAEVDSGSKGGSSAPLWAVDSTVAVWQVQRSEVMQLDDDTRKAPSPVCFRLPALASGHYQIVLSAYELQDVTRQHPVQAKVVWNNP